MEALAIRENKLAIFAENIGHELVSSVKAPLLFAKKALISDSGAINTQGFVLIAVGFVLVVFGLNFLSVIYSTAATNGSSANIGSFTGTRNLNDQVPLVVTAAVLLLGVGLLALGGYVTAKGAKM